MEDTRQSIRAKVIEQGADDATCRFVNTTQCDAIDNGTQMTPRNETKLVNDCPSNASHQHYPLSVSAPPGYYYHLNGNYQHQGYPLPFHPHQAPASPLSYNYRIHHPPNQYLPYCPLKYNHYQYSSLTPQSSFDSATTVPHLYHQTPWTRMVDTPSHFRNYDPRRRHCKPLQPNLAITNDNNSHKKNTTAKNTLLLANENIITTPVRRRQKKDISKINDLATTNTDTLLLSQASTPKIHNLPTHHLHDHNNKDSNNTIKNKVESIVKASSETKWPNVIRAAYVDETPHTFSTMVVAVDTIDTTTTSKVTLMPHRISLSGGKTKRKR